MFQDLIDISYNACTFLCVFRKQKLMVEEGTDRRNIYVKLHKTHLIISRGDTSFLASTSVMVPRADCCASAASRSSSNACSVRVPQRNRRTKEPPCHPSLRHCHVTGYNTSTTRAISTNLWKKHSVGKIMKIRGLLASSRRDWNCLFWYS